MPTEVPMIPDSARGVSITLASPYLSISPSVTLKTPPSIPTSSPRMTTLSYFAISWSRPRLMACTMFSLGIGGLLLQIGEELCPLLFDLLMPGAEDVVEQYARIVVLPRLELLHGGVYLSLDLLFQGALLLVVPEALIL